ncbi:MAG: AAA family ATPase [Candidatus Rokuibacteriota bacterium]
MRCPQCAQENPPGARFCNACGTPLEAVCPACAHVNASGSRFCSECGQPLSREAAPRPLRRPGPPESYTPRHLAERILTSRSALEGERKQVTVLFADLKASLELLADRDPEEARQLLDPVLDRMMDAVHRYEGTVNQVMGDGIMALFGAPLAHEDHAVRACYAALRMQESVTQYGDEMQRLHGVPLQIRVGLNSGEVVVRSIGSDLHMDYTAVGQTTHLAGRMEQMAKPGSVLLTVASLKLAEGYVVVKPLGPIPVRGLADPVEVFELVGVAATRTRLGVRAARGLTRFVGRDPELEQLRQALERARAGHGQVVALVGEPGVGKSRLAWEFIRSHRTHGWLVLEATAVSYGKTMPFVPVIDLLKTYFAIEDRDDARRTREKLTGKLLTLDESLKPSLPALLALLDVPFEDPQWQRLAMGQRRQRTLDAVRRLLLRESHVQPLLLVFEDLHWIDTDTQALLDSLIESLPTARLLLLVNYRPEYRHAWGGKSYYSQLRLDPLPPDRAEALLQALLGDDGELQPLKRLLIDRTQGNPFFLEESVQTLVETQALVGDRGAYRVAKGVQTIVVPATVQAILAARIDRLPHDDKRLLQSASVIGKDVPFALLHAIAELPEEALRQGLSGLQAGEFLHETRLFPEGEYTFKHALTHEVAYAGLLHERRRALHVRIVDALERLYPDRLAEHADRLAHHAFRGEAWGKALTYLRQTAASASPSSLDAALTGGPESPGYLWLTGDYDRALRAGQRELAVAASFRNFGMQVVTDFRLGQIHHSLGDYPSATEFLRRNVAALEGDLIRERFGMAGLPAVLSRVWLAWCLAEQGAFVEGLGYAGEGLQLAEAADHPYSLILASFGLGTLFVLKGDLSEAICALERGLVLDQVESLPLLFPFVAAPLGLAYARSGRAAEALPLLEQAVEQAAAMKLMANQSLRVTWLGEAHALAGRLDAATEHARRALALSHGPGERGHQAYALRLLAETMSDRDAPDVETAESSYRQAQALADELGMRPLVARCCLGLGRLALRIGRRPQARSELEAAIALFQSMAMADWLARAEAEVARLDA